MSVSNRFCAIQQAGRVADIHIFGDIVAEQWYEDETSAFSLSKKLKDLDVDEINVYIDSYGGVISEGWAIYNQLKQHPAKVKTYGVGFVASAALYPFMAGDERYAVEPSAYFFHNAVGGAAGYAKDLRAAADELEKLTEIGMAAFTTNTSMTEEDVAALMESETWLSPKEALEKGIATAILQERPASGVAQSAKGRILQQLLAGQARKEAEVEEAPQETAEVQEVSEPETPAKESKSPETVLQALNRMFSNERRK